jgi:hypothetical protein
MVIHSCKIISPTDVLKVTFSTSNKSLAKLHIAVEDPLKLNLGAIEEVV